MSRLENLVKIPLKMSLFIENRKNFRKDLEIHFRWFAILNMYFLVKFRPCILVFDKVTSLLIPWQFDRRIDCEIHNDFIGMPRDLLILVLLKKAREVAST